MHAVSKGNPQRYIEEHATSTSKDPSQGSSLLAVRQQCRSLHHHAAHADVC